ncbi:MAG TPA: vWA domain-containing protein [Symbiobacteriaceae bacterium]|nr:vWA domain-containing protein [Symbiobacteriaceae bacterium]
MKPLAALLRRLTLLGVISAAILMLPLPVPARAAETAGPVQADVILLLDRSGSMVKNDPQGLADTGPQVFVDMLDPGDRVAVVAFDTDARLLLPLTSVGDGTAARKALAGMGRPAGEWTDIKSALTAALDQLGQPSADRAPAVLLFTDGKPETQPDGVPAGYRAELAETVSRLAGRAVPVFTVGLGSADFATLNQIATGTRAEAFAAASAPQVVEVFTDVLSRVKERRVNLAFTEDLAPGVLGPAHTFTVPPYTRLLTLSGVASGGVKLHVAAPGGGDGLAPPARVSSGANYAVVSIPNPAPGAWSVRLEGSGRAVAQAQTESALRLQLLQPQPYSQVQRQIPVAVAVSGDPDPQSPLEVWAQSGAAPAVKLAKDGARYEERITVDDGRLAVWAVRAGGEVARREFRVYPVGLPATAGAPAIGAAANARRWVWPVAVAAAAVAGLLGAGALNWRRIKRREEQLSGRLGSHGLSNRGKSQTIGDLARLEATLVSRGWAPLAGLGLVQRELQIHIRPQSPGVRMQINSRPPGDGRLYHEDEVTLGGETMIFHNPRLPRRPLTGHRKPAVARAARRSTFKG